MKKTYKANTNISINVVLLNKQSKHISFIPLSDGSSTYTTDSEELMKAIERHYNYGKLFRLIRITDEKTRGEDSEAANVFDKSTPEDEKETIAVEKTSESATGLQKVAISDIASAKDYLADRFGVSRTMMRSTKSIVEQAAIHGIEFEGI